MNVLLLDQTGAFLNFALLCRKAGHNVKTCMGLEKATGKPNRAGDGLIEKVKAGEWPAHMRWADIIITSDNTRWLRELDVWRTRGFPIFAPSFASAELEIDREKGQDLFKKVGINTVPYEVFTNYKRAEEYASTCGMRLVSKPIGDGDADKSLSYVAKSEADMVFMLRRWEELNKGVPKFLLQEFVGGIELAVGAWLGPKGFSPWACENWEFKKLMNDDKGCNTGEMGTVVKYTKSSALAEQVLWPLERELLKLGHTGYVDVAVIIDEHGDPRPLEFTSRPGWPLFNIQQTLHEEPVEWMLQLLDGEMSFKPKPDVAIGVVLAMPDFPYTKLEKKFVTGIPIYNLNDENPLRHLIAPCELMHGVAPAMVDDEVVDTKLMVSTGDYLVTCCGLGDTVTQAHNAAYKTVDSLEVPNSLMYRTDIGGRLKKQLPDLKKLGYCRDWSY